MRLVLIAIITVIVGAVAGVFYANRFGDPHPPQTAVAEKKAPASTKTSPAASISQARQLEQRRKRMRHEALSFFASLDESGCSLDPMDSELYADDSRYSMRYHMPDGSERVLEMTGADLKAFGLHSEAQLQLNVLECSSQGRYVDAGTEWVRVREQRVLSADRVGMPVQIRQTRSLIVKPGADGRWRIQEIIGTGHVR